MADIRYYAASVVLKAFSLNGLSRRAYRKVGNRLAKGKHAYTSPEAIRRGLWFIEMVEQAGVHLNNHSTVLEIGTGWTHFYGIFLHFFWNPKTYLFDIWDNRQLNALKEKYCNLPDSLEDLLPAKWQDRLPEIRRLTAKIGAVTSFDDLYALLNMVYCIEPEGRLDVFPTNQFDLVFSGDVMEHIHRNSLESVVENMHRILKPGGVSIHQIGIDDHLTHYAPGQSTKKYISYSGTVWKLFFENQVQYFNRVQLPEYLDIFDRNGFEMLACSTEEDPDSLNHVTPAGPFRKFDDKTLQTTRGYIVHRRKA